MRQILTIATNAFMEMIRQPVFLLIMSATSLFSVFLATAPFFALGDDPKLVKDSVLATTFLSGLLCAVLSASATVSQEIRGGTALAVLAKPVSRAHFLIAKFLGLAGALTLLTYVNTLAALIAGRNAYDQYGDPDYLSTAVYFGAVVLAYLVAGFGNYFMRRPFVSDAVLAVTGLTTLAYIVIANFMVLTRNIDEVSEIDPRMAWVALLILFALWILAGLALVSSTRLDTLPTLAIVGGLFMVGLMSDYLFGRAAEQGVWWAKTCYAIFPNWQLFWVADAIQPGGKIPLTYVVQSLGYLASYAGAVACLGLILFEDRELS